MATWVGHGVVGAGVVRAAGGGGRAALLGGAFANTPDLDLLAGLLARGDAGAFHPAPWSHSPVVALYAVIAVAAWHGVRAWGGRRAVTVRVVLRDVTLGAAVMLTHPLLDFVLVNPTTAVPFPDDVFSLAGAARHALALASDAVFYGAMAAALVWVGRGRRPAM